MGRLSWIIRCCGCNHNHPNRNEAGGVGVRGEGDGMMEAEAGRCRECPQAKEHMKPLEAERARKLIILSEPPKGTKSAHTLTLAQ